MFGLTLARLRAHPAGLLLAALAMLVLIVPAPALAAGVNADLGVLLKGTYTGTNDLGSVSFAFNQSASQQFTSGTTTGKADKLFSDTRTLAASATENLDLAGSLTDPFGVTSTFVKVKAIYIKAAAGNTNSVVVGGAGSNTFTGPFADATDKVTIPPGGFVLLVHPGAGWTVTAATGDILLVANSSSGTSVSYDVVIIGTSA